MDFLIHHMLLTSAARYPDKEALVDVTQRLTYADAATNSAALASGLAQLGVKRGDRVGIWLETSARQAISILGASQSGGVFVPINSLLFPDQAAHIMRDCGTVALIATKEKINSVVGVIETLPCLRFMVAVDGKTECEAKIPVYSSSEILAAADGCSSQNFRI